MELLLKKLLEIPEAAALAEAVERGDCPAAVTGLSPVHKAQMAAALARAGGRPLVMVCADEGEASRLAGDGDPAGRPGPAALRPGALCSRWGRGLPPVGAGPPGRPL